MRLTTPFSRDALLLGALPLGALFLGLTAASAADIRLGDDVVPTSQSIYLKLDADEAEYSGSVEIELEVRKKADQFYFHSEAQELTRFVLEGRGKKIDLVHEKVNDDTVSVRTAAPLKKGRYTLKIGFSSPFGTHAVGLYRTEKDGVGYSFTQFESDEAREAFPIWDEPRFKIPYQMTLSVPVGHVAITNTPIEEESEKGGWRTTRFQRTKPLPSYLLAIATGPFDTVDMPGLGVPGRIVTVQGQSHLAELAIEMTPPILRALEAYFDGPYPFEKLDFIAVPEFWPGAMENPGLVTYSDRILLVDPEAASIGQRRTLAVVIAHELAHMWFGNLVTMEWWDDLWLNESFADWMGDKIAGQIYPEFNVDISTVRSAQFALGIDARATTEAIRQPIDTAKHVLSRVGLAYAKGNAALGMFEAWLGEETFRKGVNVYLQENAWGNATAADLWQGLDQVSGKPVAKALSTFIEQPGFPLIEVEILEDGRLKLEQERFRNYGSKSEDLIWMVPVILKYAAGGRVGTKTVLLDKPSVVVDLGLEKGAEVDWVYPNGDARGYYRWQLDAERLQELATQAETILTTQERIELLNSVAALLSAGTIHGGEYLEVVGLLARDPEPPIVQAVMREIGRVEGAFVTPELEDAYAAYVRRTLGPALERIGLEESPGEDEEVSSLRPSLIRWLGVEGRDDALVEHSEALAKAYLKDSSSVQSELIGVVLSIAAIDGDRELFEEYKRRFESAKTPTERGRFLGAMGAFKDEEIRQTALEYSLEGPLRPNEIFAIGGRFSDDAGRDMTFKWFTENFDRLMTRFPPEFASGMVRMGGGCSREHLSKVKEFFNHPDRVRPDMARRFARVTEQVEDCVGLRRREGEAVEKYLLAGSQVGG